MLREMTVISVVVSYRKEDIFRISSVLHVVWVTRPKLAQDCNKELVHVWLGNFVCPCCETSQDEMHCG